MMHRAPGPVFCADGRRMKKPRAINTGQDSLRCQARKSDEQGMSILHRPRPLDAKNPLTTEPHTEQRQPVPTILQFPVRTQDAAADTSIIEHQEDTPPDASYYSITSVCPVSGTKLAPAIR